MSRCSEGHFRMYHLPHKFSILSGGACLKRWPGSRPRSSTNRGAVIPPHNPTHPPGWSFGIRICTARVGSICGFVSGSASVCRPPAKKSASNLPADRSPFSARDLTFAVCEDVCLVSRGLFLLLSHPPHQHSSMKTGCHQAQLLIHNRSAMCDCL